MRNFVYLASAVLILGLSAQSSQQGNPPQEKKTAVRTLKLKLNYGGAGTVDEKHRIFIFLFDSPDFVQGGVMPFASKAATSKNGTVTFDDITVSPVYAAAAFDPKGEYDGESGPPPSGCVMGMYSKTPGKPEPIPIEPGKTAEVDFAFDDTAKMP